MAVSLREISGISDPSVFPFIPQTYEFFTKGQEPRLGPSLPMGDLMGRDYDVALELINSAASKTWEAPPPLSLSKKLDGLQEKLESVRAYVDNPANYPLGAELIIQVRHKVADQFAQGRPMQERVAARISGMPLHVVTDLDGTVTVNPPDYLEKIPGSAVAEPVLAERGRNVFPLVYAKVWQPLLKDAPGLFELAGEYAPIREGVNRTLGYLKNNEVKVTVISANFEPFVHAVLENIPNAINLPVFSVTKDSLAATDKGILLKHLAKETPHFATIFVGDGSSDIPALEARDLISCYFALEGSSFAQKLEEESIPYFTYETFDDITVQLDKLQRLASPQN